MPIKVECLCGGRFQAPDAALGKRVKCPKCGAGLTIVAPVEAKPVEQNQVTLPVGAMPAGITELEDEARPHSLLSLLDDVLPPAEVPKRPTPPRSMRSGGGRGKNPALRMAAIGGGCLLLLLVIAIVISALSGGNQQVAGVSGKEGASPIEEGARFPANSQSQPRPQQDDSKLPSNAKVASDGDLRLDDWSETVEEGPAKPTKVASSASAEKFSNPKSNTGKKLDDAPREALDKGIAPTKVSDSDREDMDRRLANLPAEFVQDATPEQLAGIQKTLAVLQDAIEKSQTDRVAKELDAARMHTQMHRMKLMKGLPWFSTSEVDKWLAQNVPKEIINYRVLYRHERFEVVRCLATADGNEVLAYVRHWEHDGGSDKRRWWFRRNGEHWRFYDEEHIAVNERMTVGWSTAFASDITDEKALQRRKFVNEALEQATKAFATNQVEVAEQALARIPLDSLSELPNPTLAIRHLGEGFIHAHHDRWQKALDEYAEAERYDHDMPCLLLNRADAYAGLKDHNQCLDHASRYLETMGPDAHAYYLQAESLEGLGRRDEALAAYRRGLADEPTFELNLVGLARLLPRGKNSEVVEGFHKLKKPEEAFASVAEGLINMDDGPSLQEVMDDTRKRSPGVQIGEYYEMHARILQQAGRGVIRDWRHRSKTKPERARLVEDTGKTVTLYILDKNTLLTMPRSELSAGDLTFLRINALKKKIPAAVKPASKSYWM